MTEKRLLISPNESTAMRMRVAGHTYKEIAEELSVCKSRAAQIVQGGYRRLVNRSDHPDYHLAQELIDGGHIISTSARA